MRNFESNKTLLATNGGFLFASTADLPLQTTRMEKRYQNGLRTADSKTSSRYFVVIEKGFSMRIKTQLFMLLAVGCLFAFSSQAQAQCLSCKHGAGAHAVQNSYGARAAVAPVQATAGCGCSSGCNSNGCDLPGPTVPGEMPKLPIQTCCGSPMGYDNVPSLFTRPRTYTPPIGKAVGRPLFGRWTGF